MTIIDERRLTPASSSGSWSVPLPGSLSRDVGPAFGRDPFTVVLETRP